MEKDVIVILDNVRSAHNVGSIFRTSDAAGVTKLFLCGITPTPTDRFGRPQPEIEKTALGATHTVPWEQIGNGADRATDATITLIHELKNVGYTTVAVEQVKGAISLFDFSVPARTVYIFGAEVEGVDPRVVATADMALEIPMRGHKESLNISVAVGIVLFQQP